jgi:HB1, ASXL, restriction endonuclease HTH domain
MAPASKRAQIDQAIATLEGLRAAGLPASPALIESPDQGLNNSGEILQGTFLSMSLADAARKLLTIRKRPLTTSEILEGLQSGGVVFRGQAPGNVVGSILHRHSGNDIVSIARGTWGLKEWYPGRSFRLSNAAGGISGMRHEENISWALPSHTCGAQDRFAQPAHVKSFASQEIKEDKINERTKPRHDVDQHDKAGDYTQRSRNA